MLKHLHNKDYLQYIREMPCIVCMLTSQMPQETGSEAHHEEITKFNQYNKRRTDYAAVPLCNKHHAQRHSGEGRNKFWANAFKKIMQGTDWSEDTNITMLLASYTTSLILLYGTQKLGPKLPSDIQKEFTATLQAISDVWEQNSSTKDSLGLLEERLFEYTSALVHIYWYKYMRTDEEQKFDNEYWYDLLQYYKTLRDVLVSNYPGKFNFLPAVHTFNE